MRNLLNELRARGVLQVAVGYIVVGFAIIEAAALLFPREGLPDAAVQLVIAIVLFGFPVALLISWRVKRDEKASTVHGAVLALAFLAIAGISGWLGVRAIVSGPASAANETPLVLMMDSPHPARVYDQETVAASGTNADVLNDILRDLPIRRLKESIGPQWHRDEEVRQLAPDLILIHMSGFCSDECDDNRLRLRRFIEYMSDGKSKILIYGRGSLDTLTFNYRLMVGDLPQKYPELTERISLFSVVDAGTPHWKDPSTAAALKLKVKEILALNGQPSRRNARNRRTFRLRTLRMGAQ